MQNASGARTEMGEGPETRGDIRPEDEIARLETALREVIELSEGGGPTTQRLAQVRRRASAALASLDRRPG